MSTKPSTANRNLLLFRGVPVANLLDVLSSILPLNGNYKSNIPIFYNERLITEPDNSEIIFPRLIRKEHLIDCRGLSGPLQ